MTPGWFWRLEQSFVLLLVVDLHAPIQVCTQFSRDRLPATCQVLSISAQHYLMASKPDDGAAATAPADTNPATVAAAVGAPVDPAEG